MLTKYEGCSSFCHKEEPCTITSNGVCDMENNMYGIHVSFCERGYWSKPYTYKSDVPYEAGDILVVPAGKFYNCVKVVGCTENYEFPENITFKYVHSKVETNG